jgi:hypothetical protein
MGLQDHCTIMQATCLQNLVVQGGCTVVPGDGRTQRPPAIFLLHQVHLKSTQAAAAAAAGNVPPKGRDCNGW